MERITEEMNLEKQWFEDAKKQTPETLMGFINHVMNDYEHDYGTVVHAVSACALAAADAANKAPGARGGITGFQAGFVMWDFIKQWSFPHNKAGLRILNFDSLLYPQREEEFDKTIEPEQWEVLQEKAKENLANTPNAHPDVVKHWQSIVDGVVPFGFTVK